MHHGKGPSDDSLTHVNVGPPAASCHKHPGQRCVISWGVSARPPSSPSTTPTAKSHSLPEEEFREGRSSLIGSLSSSPAGQRSVCKCTNVYEWVWRSSRETMVHFPPVRLILGLDLCSLQILCYLNVRHGATAMGRSAMSSEGISDGARTSFFFFYYLAM